MRLVKLVTNELPTDILTVNLMVVLSEIFSVRVDGNMI